MKRKQKLAVVATVSTVMAGAVFGSFSAAAFGGGDQEMARQGAATSRPAFTAGAGSDTFASATIAERPEILASTEAPVVRLAPASARPAVANTAASRPEPRIETVQRAATRGQAAPAPSGGGAASQVADPPPPADPPADPPPPTDPPADPPPPTDPPGTPLMTPHRAVRCAWSPRKKRRRSRDMRGHCSQT